MGEDPSRPEVGPRTLQRGELFDAVIRATGEAVWDWDLDNALQWHNSAYMTMLGISTMAAEGALSSWEERLHPDDADRVTRSLDLVATGTAGETWAEEYRLRGDNGRYITVDDRAILVRSEEDGRPLRMVGTLRDVSQAREAAAELRDARDYSDAVLTALPGPFYHVGPDLEMVRWNARFGEVTGYSDEEIAQMRAIDFFPPSEVRRVGQAIKEVFELGFSSIQSSFRRKDDVLVPFVFTGQRFTYAGKVGYVGVAIDMSEQVALQAQLRHEAAHDHLTGLVNRARLHEELDTAVAGAREGGHRVAVLDLDLDRFKVVNDGFGHPYGDLVLRAVAQRLVSLVCPEDVVARLGGDEFVILAPLVHRREDIHEMAQRLVDSLAEPFVVEGRRIHLTGSIGVSFYPEDGATGTDLIDNADVAMYFAKAAGRSAYRAFQPHMARDTQRKIDLETRLREAAGAGRFRLAYQPKVDLASGAIIGCEALLRWNDPELGEVSPVDFIPIAEDAGLIVAIGDWVLTEACRQGRAWLDAGLPPLTLAVNVSAGQLLQQDPVGWVTSTLERTGFSADLLELELTETVLAEDALEVISSIGALRALGVKVAIDDFGTGYSSLSYLKRFDVTTIKIDQSFVHSMLGEAGDRAIVRASIALGHALGLSVIAEGVETEDQRDLLRQLRCDQIQGFLISRPVDAAEFAALLG